jgi:hypothetical protein
LIQTLTKSALPTHIDYPGRVPLPTSPSTSHLPARPSLSISCYSPFSSSQVIRVGLKYGLGVSDGDRNAMIRVGLIPADPFKSTWAAWSVTQIGKIIDLLRCKYSAGMLQPGTSVPTAYTSCCNSGRIEYTSHWMAHIGPWEIQSGAHKSIETH